MMTPWVAAKHLPHTAALQLHGDLKIPNGFMVKAWGKNMGKHGETIGPYGKIMETRGKKKQTSWTIWENMGKSQHPKTMGQFPIHGGL